MRPIPASRLRSIDRYVFSELDATIDRERRSGRQICDLAQSDPNWPPSAPVVQALRESALCPGAHRYPSFDGDLALRRAFSDWYTRHYAARCTPEHVLILEGSKLGIAILPMTYLDPGDVGIVPDPGYPPYRSAVALAGGDEVALVLRPELGYLPDYGALDEADLDRAHLMFLNYPHNPTGATASMPFLEETAQFARQENLLVAYDLAYSSIVLRGPNPALSLRSVHGADRNTIELFTFSKSYDMQGYRLGAAVANPDLLAPMRKVHENVSAGVFEPIQAAGRAALDPHEDQAVARRSAAYADRQDLMLSALRELGGHSTGPDATVYLWLHTPRGLTGDRFAAELLRSAGVAVTPGSAFGRQGAQYVRISLTADDREIAEAASRLRQIYPQGFEVAPDRAVELR